MVYQQQQPKNHTNTIQQPIELGHAQRKSVKVKLVKLNTQNK